MSSSNSVTLNSNLIRAISFIPNSVVITSGEDYELPITISQAGTVWTLTLKADRSGSEPVATSFNSKVGGSSHEYAPDGGGTGSTPGSLNFYFGVNVTFNAGGADVVIPVYLAQGHFSSTNNWWIGGNNVVNVGTPTFLLINNNTITNILKLSGGASSFTFTAA